MWSNSCGGAKWVSELRSLPVPQELSATGSAHGRWIVRRFVAATQQVVLRSMLVHALGSLDLTPPRRQ
jgi:hypothetical protein